MELKDKDLLIKDLCARLPYGTIIQVKEWAILDTTLKLGHIARLLNNDPTIKFKPYLRPMNSMTDVEAQIYETLLGGFATEHAVQLLDWLNRKMFDYRGLIPLSLALEAPEGMYKEE